MLGIPGGMGPLATVDFMQKVIALSLANSDQEHLPMLVQKSSFTEMMFVCKLALSGSGLHLVNDVSRGGY
ncbi:hypothetical protein [Endozoicomonas acroporae]|uniref:hypothetical protein n=1 Tax=Endozoicomonas acroporae TaxID=1701104 RepID=UPI003D79DD77